MSTDIAGYLVAEISDDLPTQDVYYQKRILYTKWTSAVAAAGNLAMVLSEKWSTEPICVLRSTSENVCKSEGYVVSHRCHVSRSDIVIFLVTRET